MTTLDRHGLLRLATLAVLLAGGAGCNERTLESELPPFAGACGPPGNAPAFREQCWGGIPYRPQVDLLLVVDDGASMARPQARLARAMDGLVEQLQTHESGIDLRVGVTRPSNLACGGEDRADLAPITSCRERPDGFEDRWDEACAAVCPLDTLTVEPSTTEDDATARIRPWIEFGPSGTNLRPDTTAAQALRCAVPQGLRGCAFPDLLDSYEWIRRRSSMDDQLARGFFRDDAGLAVVLLSDGVDCSVGSDHWEVFDPAGSRALWSDPQADEPTPAVCWNAGVACTPAGSGPSLECASISLDAQGESTEDDERRIMNPPSDYVTIMREHAWALDVPSGEPVVLALTGVADDPEATVYAPSADEEFQREHGIGPGCEGPDGPALPPVRIREVVEDLEGQLYSICADDFSEPMRSLADSIAAVKPAICLPYCAADLEPERDGLQVECRVDVELPSDDGLRTRYSVPRCEPDEQDEPQLPPDERLCWFPKADERLSTQCADEGANLEIELRWSSPRPPIDTVVPDCRVAEEGFGACRPS